MDDLAAWLTQIWIEEERLAKRAGDALTTPEIDNYGHLTVPSGWMLARIAADRQILADWQQANGEHQSWCEEYDDFGAIEDYGRADHVRGALESLERIVRHLATAYADRPGYREEWAVSR